jgi:uncharacterized protein YdiU (UPF0061 family)
MTAFDATANPLLTLPYEPAFESLGDDYFDRVPAAEFPKNILRFRNDDILPLLNLDAQDVSDADFITAFGQFRGRQPFLAMRYHGYQFGEYNPFLGDGRGFLYGQVRGTDDELYDFGTKGSGSTPYSRGGDGRLTLKGGVREVLAAEMLHRLGVRTSRCLSLIETGEALWRGDEPSPTRSSVMVRFSRSHIRFGTFERLHYLQRPDLIHPLLDHVIEIYYPHLKDPADDVSDRYARFYAELVERVARLAAEWMSVGFCHAVLNTDNMSITGESFDYGPYAFIDRYEPRFTAAYFDYSGRYSYGNQPGICRLNLHMLQVPLQAAIAPADMEAALSHYDDHYQRFYRQRMLRKLGFATLPDSITDKLIGQTLSILKHSSIGYHDFFAMLRQRFAADWRSQPENVLADFTPEAIATDNHSISQVELLEKFAQWRSLYHHALNNLPESEMSAVSQYLGRHNPSFALVRPEIEAIWEPIVVADNWQPFEALLKRIQAAVDD